jgi:peptidoglycan-associated lipoprotein
MLLRAALVTKVSAMSSSPGVRWLILLVALVIGGAVGCGRPKYPSCDGDKDCKAPEKCVNKKCVPCRDNMDCPEGQQCSATNSCEPLPGWCAGDNDCGVFEVCKNNKCSPCASDGECGPGGTCREGKCIRPGTCESDDDCPEDQDCVNNRCVRPGLGTNIKMPSCPMAPVYFGFDVYTLSDDAKALLQKNYECLQANRDRTVAVVGHTDPRGTIEYNISLSDDRAQAVVTYLGRLGVDPARLRKVPKGSGEATGSDEASYAKDRRVEFQWE